MIFAMMHFYVLIKVVITFTAGPLHFHMLPSTLILSYILSSCHRVLELLISNHVKIPTHVQLIPSLYYDTQFMLLLTYLLLTRVKDGY